MATLLQLVSDWLCSTVLIQTQFLLMLIEGLSALGLDKQISVVRCCSLMSSQLKNPISIHTFCPCFIQMYFLSTSFAFSFHVASVFILPTYGVHNIINHSKYWLTSQSVMLNTQPCQLENTVIPHMYFLLSCQKYESHVRGHCSLQASSIYPSPLRF